ncbi:MAG TPA: DUF1080 domain-containing protein [Planctomycetaceae bacterium]|nr:hypothetical protein [Blastopirellula sp.]HAY79437.1 DUF1080 domain-containing protein [Planctomycetaceae bacterium]
MTRYVVTAILLTSSQLAFAAGPKSDTYTDAQAAGPDYALQGEFAGEADTPDGKRKFGAQVIALGDHRFRVIGYYGGLPGDGWSRGDKLESREVEIQGDSGQFTKDNAVITITADHITIEADGNTVAKLKKVHRKSPTLGAKPPAGAKVLFDGSSVAKFNNGKLTEGKLLAATNVESKAKFKDHSFHIEFRTPFMPKARGQGRGNSGVYVQSRYEVQVLDSFGLDGKDNECGGIYQVSKPIVNMCLPPLAWQTYDIDFTAAKYDKDGKKTANARVTVKHNGVTIHDDLELPKQTPGRHAEGPTADSLFMQDHSNPVAFRNIWVVEK